MLGWSTVLFLDEDIRGLDASDVCYAAGGLQSSCAVGFEVEHWSDRSVVGRIDPTSSASHGAVVGAAALLVDPTSPLLGHFPAIHNADRLFLYDAFLHGEVQQAPVRVHRFADSAAVNLQRAGAEEFGEVIGAGLIQYVRHRGRALVPLHEAYWREVLADRREFIDEVASRLVGTDYPIRASSRPARGAGGRATSRGHHAHVVRAVLPALATGAADLAGATGQGPHRPEASARLCARSEWSPLGPRRSA